MSSRIDQFLDDELDETTAETVRQHLLECEDCSTEAEAWVVIRHAVKRAYEPDAAPASLLERITAELATSDKQETPAI
jgi:anti-sigma factor (TIGR02949 family)